MRVTFNKVAYTILFCYFVTACYTGYILVRNRIWKEKYQQEKFRQMSELAEDDINWNPWGEEFEDEQPNPISHHEPPKILWDPEPHRTDGKLAGAARRGNNSMGIFSVEIWGKASIGDYLWQHILEAPLEERMGGVWSYGAKTVSNIKFTFRKGPGVVPDQVPKSTENLLLILNGREPDKIAFAKTWLDSLATLSQLTNVGVVLLGDEKCNNQWIYPYMHYKGGPIRFVFLVYDSPDIDDVNFYQWPLGVATYREFPVVDSSQLPVHKHRKHSCNFLGTVYKNSSRETLLKLLQTAPLKDQCVLKPRMSWLPEESADTREDYIRVLSQSDLTLHPVGQNSECYRVYEAIAYGSLPVIEDVMTPGNCGAAKTSGWLPEESADTREDYIRTLSQSDLTLHPVGQNSECYRVYEAIAYGSLPVIEDVMTPGDCGAAKTSGKFPLRLLKETEAPVIYLKDWSELTKILANEKLLRHSDRVKRRRSLLLWYESFKSKMREKLIRVINKHFFGVINR